MAMNGERVGCGEGSRFVGVGAGVTSRIIGVFYQVHNELGFGFLESVYKVAMRMALREAGLGVEAEVELPVTFRGETIGVFRADLMVERQVILELKVAERITKMHEAQLVHYLRATEMEVGLVMNFGETATVRRVTFMNDRKKGRMGVDGGGVEEGLRG